VFDVPTAEELMQKPKTGRSHYGKMTGRSGRDKPIQVVMHVCIEAMLGISLHRYLSQTSKSSMSFLLLLCLLFNKIAWKQEGWEGEDGDRGLRGEIAPNTVCTY
jgi:hypothetical protein